MSQLHAIQALLAMTKEARDDVARRLGEARMSYDQSQEKYHLLEHYRLGYLKRQEHEFRESMASSQILQRYSAFIAKLELAIQQQKEDVNFRQKVLDMTRSELIDCEKRLQSLELYVQKQARLYTQIENKKEQKLMDEYAAGVTRQKINSNKDHYEPI